MQDQAELRSLPGSSPAPLHHLQGLKGKAADAAVKIWGEKISQQQSKTHTIKKYHKAALKKQHKYGRGENKEAVGKACLPTALRVGGC